MNKSNIIITIKHFLCLGLIFLFSCTTTPKQHIFVGLEKTNLTTRLNHHWDVQKIYFDTFVSKEALKTSFDNKKIPLLNVYANKDIDPTLFIEELLDQIYDDQLDQMIPIIKAYPYPVMINFLPLTHYKKSLSPTQFQNAFSYISNYFNHHNVSNISWVINHILNENNSDYVPDKNTFNWIILSSLNNNIDLETLSEQVQKIKKENNYIGLGSSVTSLFKDNEELVMFLNTHNTIKAILLNNKSIDTKGLLKHNLFKD